jgi:hypothetical protein
VEDLLGGKGGGGGIDDMILAGGVVADAPGSWVAFSDS